MVILVILLLSRYGHFNFACFAFRVYVEEKIESNICYNQHVCLLTPNQAPNSLINFVYIVIFKDRSIERKRKNLLINLPPKLTCKQSTENFFFRSYPHVFRNVLRERSLNFYWKLNNSTTQWNSINSLENVLYIHHTQISTIFCNFHCSKLQYSQSAYKVQLYG